MVVYSSEASAPHISSSYIGEKRRQSLYHLIYFLYSSYATRWKSTDRFVKSNSLTKYIEKKKWRSLASNLSKFLGISEGKIVNTEHHLLHAYTALYASPFSDEPTLVFTCDGEGDFLSATVSVFDGQKLQRVTDSSYTESLGMLWAGVTTYLGMKSNEHEYKVMGLAPYASEDGIERANKALFRNLMVVDDNLRLRSKINMSSCSRIMKERLVSLRFDYIAGALQEMTEQLLTDWISKAIDRYQIHNVAFAGGVFLNVKANMKIAQMKTVKKAFFMPSAGDESLAIGAAYFGAKALDSNARIEPIRELYLGPRYGNDTVENLIDKYSSSIKFSQHADINNVLAELLSKGEIVSRCSGRMEWGARALGNRSILADPTNPDVIRTINLMIKQRDFWMPFAPSIIDEMTKTYIEQLDPIKTSPEYMMVAFETTEKGKKDLKGAMHPYDFTIRPQVLSKQFNPEYYSVIESFLGKTGRGGILNTSFNLHGEPIVCTPEDAISTLLRSGLKFLVIEDYLLEKIAA